MQCSIRLGAVEMDEESIIAKWSIAIATLDAFKLPLETECTLATSNDLLLLVEHYRSGHHGQLTFKKCIKNYLKITGG